MLDRLPDLPRSRSAGVWHANKPPIALYSTGMTWYLPETHGSFETAEEFDYVAVQRD
jgi:phage terminase large subunit-like protein